MSGIRRQWSVLGTRWTARWGRLTLVTPQTNYVTLDTSSPFSVLFLSHKVGALIQMLLGSSSALRGSSVLGNEGHMFYSSVLLVGA